MSAPAVALLAASRGALLKLDKPQGPTSHDVVHAVRRHLGVRRVGHAGTLDPQATGLLVVGVGPATRLLGFIALQDKFYRGTLRLGVATDTLDAAGRVTAEKPWPRDERRVREAARTLVGERMQRPPMVSAVKVHGERLYKIAARGEEVERPERRVRVKRLELLGFDLEAGRLSFEVECSSGTYVRVLAEEWGAALDTVAHLDSLRRVRVGAIDVEGAFPAARLAPRGTHPAGNVAKGKDAAPADWRGLENARLPWEVALSHLSRRVLDAREAKDLGFGRAPRSRGERGLLRLEDENGVVLGVAEGTPLGLPIRLRCVLAPGDERA
ncbi:MAG TPA: tRNA pseudouridine(55) synthase TruB [Candidatus Eisenbacteria bacterium]|nr:tRNA pseudouridine(55) synthase TruB [Candidatus Eisenbacteria bacterium]